MYKFTSLINLIEILKYIVLGLTQGIAEVLPISSSGHLLLLSDILNINISLGDEVFLHLGSLIAVIIYMRKQLLSIFNNSLKYCFKKINNTFNKNKYPKSIISTNEKNNFKLLIYLIISTIPLVIITILLNGYIESINCNLNCVGFLFLINGLMVYITGKKMNLKKLNDINKMSYYYALKIGLYQSFGIFSGISRSGTCLLGGSELQNEENSNYAFLLFVPVCFGALVNELIKGSINVTVNSLTAFIIVIPVTLFSLKILKKIITNNKYKLFGIYTFILGVIILIIKLF